MDRAATVERPLRAIPHLDTWLALEQTATPNWDRMAYRRTYHFPGEWIDDYHRGLSTVALREDGFIDLGLAGWLLRADALKLYELAYFAGDVLELGTCCGLSASVIARAIHGSGRERAFATVDLDPTIQDAARWGLNEQDVPRRELIRYFRMDGAAFLRDLIARGEPRSPPLLDRLLRRREQPGPLDGLPRRFSLVFVDHAHTYEAVAEVCPLLDQIIAPGGFALFHDYNDPRNIRPDDPDYGVYQAVRDALSKDRFEFYGVFGCTGLYRRVGSPQGLA